MFKHYSAVGRHHGHNRNTKIEVFVLLAIGLCPVCLFVFFRSLLWGEDFQQQLKMKSWQYWDVLIEIFVKIIFQTPVFALGTASVINVWLPTSDKFSEDIHHSSALKVGLDI